MNVRARTVSLFRNNKSQAVRIPKDWEFQDDDKVEILKIGQLIVLQTAKKPRTSWLEVMERMEPCPEFEPDRTPIGDGSRFLSHMLSDADNEK